MNAVPAALLALLTVSVLAGCAYEPQPRVVDFSGVDESQPGARFELRVKVVGLRNGSVPLSEAFVGAAEGSQAIAKATTDEDGIAVLRLQSGQTIRIVASAPGWTTEDSGKIRIGRSSGDDSRNNAVAGCSGGAANSQDGQAAGGWCMITAGHDDAATVDLEGENATVSVVLFPQHMRQVFTQEIGPNLDTPFITLPDGDEWIRFHSAVQEDSALHELQMLRLQNATTTLAWTNEMLSQADFELGVGCNEGEPEESSDETLPAFREQTRVVLSVEYLAGEEGRWSSCTNYYAGPIVSSANLPVEITLVNQLTFRGRSTIIPIE